MRSPIAVLVAGLALSACTVVIQQPAQSGSPVSTVNTSPAPVPDLVPLEITLARPVDGRLYVQTNRPAYIAIFEIIPGHSVSLAHPASAGQRITRYSGMTWLPASWTPQRPAPTQRASLGRSRTAATPVVEQSRYIYALASDRPLSIPADVFEANRMQILLGSAYSSTSPTLTMRTIARRFVPSVRDEMWAEDALPLAASYDEQSYATVRVYCGRGTVYKVPAEVADRALCPTAGPTSRPTSPDSVLHDNGRRVQRRPIDPPGRRRMDRVADLPVADAPVGEGTNNGNGVGRPDDRGDNGRKLGHTDPVKPGGGRPTETNPPANPGANPEQQGKPEAKPETKPDTKPDTKPEAKPETKPVETAQPVPADSTVSKGKPATPGTAREKPKPEAVRDSTPGKARGRPD